MTGCACDRCRDCLAAVEMEVLAARLAGLQDTLAARTEALRPFVTLLDLDEDSNPPGHRSSFIGAPRQAFVEARAALALNTDGEAT